MLKLDNSLYIKILLVLVLGMASCSEREPLSQDTQETWEVMAILPPDGMGDLGYCDEMYHGLSQMRDSLGCRLYTYLPWYAEDAENQAKAWLEQKVGANTHRLLVLCDGSYASMVTRNNWKNSGNTSILLLDNNDEDMPVYTRTLLLYGACYAIGKVGDDISKTTGKRNALMMANTDDWAISEGAAGFKAGAEKVGMTVDQYSLYDEYTRGYNVPDSAYHLCYDIAPKTGFVLCLAGKSNEGVRRYGRDERSDVIWSCSSNDNLSDHDFFVIQRDIHKMLLDFAAEWKGNKSMKLHSLYGLESDYVLVVSMKNDSGLGNSFDAAQKDAISKENERYGL